MEVLSGQVRRNHSHLRVRATPSESEAVTTDRDHKFVHELGLRFNPLLATPSDVTARREV